MPDPLSAQCGAESAKKGTRGEVHARLRDIFNAPDHERALDRAHRLMEEWRDRFPQFVDWVEESIEAPLAVFTLPEKHRQRLRTTNRLERYQQEIRRRSRVVRIFPNRESCLRLSSALAMEQSEDWLTGHRYLDMEIDTEEPVEIMQSNILEPVSA